MKFKLPKGYLGNVIIQESVLDSAISELTDVELRTYLKICVLCTNKTDKEMDSLVSLFGFDSSEELYSVLSLLEKKKFIKISASGVSLVSENIDNAVVKRFKNNLDNDIAVMKESDVASIVRTAEKCFGKMLSVAEINSLTNLNTWYGLSNEVILILIEYVSMIGKKSISYIEKTALDWSEKEIDTPKKAHDYIREQDEKRTVYGKIKTLLKI